MPDKRHSPGDSRARSGWRSSKSPGSGSVFWIEADFFHSPFADGPLLRTDLRVPISFHSARLPDAAFRIDIDRVPTDAVCGESGRFPLSPQQAENRVSPGFRATRVQPANIRARILAPRTVGDPPPDFQLAPLSPPVRHLAGGMGRPCARCPHRRKGRS